MPILEGRRIRYRKAGVRTPDRGAIIGCRLQRIERILQQIDLVAIEFDVDLLPVPRLPPQCFLRSPTKPAQTLNKVKGNGMQRGRCGPCPTP